MTELTVETATEVIRDHAVPGRHEDLVGVEVELHVFRNDSPQSRVPPADVEAATAAVRSDLDGSLSFEPGGQVEISSNPSTTAHEAIVRTARDLALVRAACSDAGLVLVGGGMDPTRLPERVNTAPRYEAMDRYFGTRDTGSPPWAPDMMCNTAAVQVNVGLGNRTAESRWRIAHAVGPVLVASFASSPFRHGVPTGWKSTRQVIWWNLDTCRTRPVRDGTVPDTDVAACWARYALDAQVMFIQSEGGVCTPITRDLSMRDWLEGAHNRVPQEDDLVSHLSTLFPPVRPRGWLELRMIDMPPDDWWAVPVFLIDALLRVDSVADRIAEICAPVSGAWLAAAHRGLEDRKMARAAVACFELAADATSDPDAAATIRDYGEAFVFRGRTPADEMLGAEVRSGVR